MFTYCLVCKENTKNIDAKMIKTKNGKLVLLSKCAVCGNKKSRIMKEQEAKGLLSSNGAKSYSFVNDTEIHKFEANDSEIVTTPL